MSSPSAVLVSVIVPTLDEAGVIQEMLQGVLALPGHWEVIVADAYLEQTGSAPFNSMTLLAAQTDFKEAGELLQISLNTIFIYTNKIS